MRCAVPAAIILLTAFAFENGYAQSAPPPPQMSQAEEENLRHALEEAGRERDGIAAAPARERGDRRRGVGTQPEHGCDRHRR